MKTISVLPADAMSYAAVHAREIWHCWVPVTTRSEDVTKSAFWTHVMDRLKPGALIDLVTRDGTLDMTVRIVDVVNGIVRVNVLRHFEDKEARAHIFKAIEESQSFSLEDGAHIVEAYRHLVPKGYKVGFHPTKHTFYVVQSPNRKINESEITFQRALAFTYQHAEAAGIDVTDLREQAQKELVGDIRKAAA